jgi:HlyD family secretion protein
MKKWVFSFLLVFLLMLSSCSDKDKMTYLGYIQGRYIYLSSSIAGDLIHRLVRRGDEVKQGQKLYVLDPNPQQSEIEQAQAQLIQARQTLANLIHGQRETVLEQIIAEQRQAEADYILAKQNLKRYTKLYHKGAIGKAELDSRTATYKSADQKVKELNAQLAEAKLGARKHLIFAQEADVENVRAQIKEFEWELSQKTMYANKSGLIFDTFYREGEYVPAGQAVLAVLPPENIRVQFFVPEKELSKIKIGQPVTFDCDSCKSQGHATIYYISPQAEYTPPVIYSRDTREKLVYQVEADMKPQEAIHYHPGQPIEVSIPS